MAAFADIIDSSSAIHIFGFGRSGTSALAMAIRMRHFMAPEKGVFWLGDQVRDPIRGGDAVILVSRSGDRKEVVSALESALEKKARTVVITHANTSPLTRGAALTIFLQGMEGDLAYGGGDFELAAWYFQEVFLTWYGLSRKIPKEKVGRNHV
ncbi:MAG: SIS domain-containing protein [Methanolinea sp.]|nr:SIS domain-containing protein [Methanolinea sp.]